MEEAAEMGNYLPLSFKSPKEQEYIDFLWETFETNYTYGKYQFAFLAYHMLTMSAIYFNIWQIRQSRPEDFEKALIGFGKEIEKKLLEATSPFVFSKVNERSILRLLKLIACDNGEIGTYAKLVDDRNDTVHPNGNIFFSTQAALDIKIRETLRVLEDIQHHTKTVIKIHTAERERTYARMPPFVNTSVEVAVSLEELRKRKPIIKEPPIPETYD